MRVLGNIAFTAIRKCVSCGYKVKWADEFIAFFPKDWTGTCPMCDGEWKRTHVDSGS